MPGVTPGREAAVMAFVRQHHADLADLLIYLKSNQPREYQLAVRDLFRTSERLAQMQERDVERCELELALWKAGSRVQLLAARSQMSKDEQWAEQLRQVLNDQVDLRLQLLQYDRQRQADRLKRIDEQLENTAEKREQMVERQLRRLLGEPKPVKTSAAGNDRNSEKKPSGKNKRRQPTSDGSNSKSGAGPAKKST